MKNCVKRTMDKENWKDRILESTRGMKRAEPSPDVFNRLMDRLHEPVRSTAVVRALPKLQLRLIAACMLVLIGFNGWTVYRTLNRNNSRMSADAVYSDDGYAGLFDHYNLYEQ